MIERTAHKVDGNIFSIGDASSSNFCRACWLSPTRPNPNQCLSSGHCWNVHFGGPPTLAYERASGGCRGELNFFTRWTLAVCMMGADTGWQDGQTVHCVAEVLVAVHLLVRVGGEEVLGDVENVLRQVDATVTAWMETWRAW